MLFYQKYRKTIIACILLFFSLIALTYSVKQPSGTGLIRQLVLEATAGLTYVVSVPLEKLSNAWGRYIFLIGLEEEIRRLRIENAQMERELLQYREGYIEALRLQNILKLKESIRYPTVAARVISMDQTALIKTALIDKGTSHGIKAGFPVVAERGVVGRIIESSWQSSRVLLLIDENSKIDAMVQESRSQGILHGSGSKGCSLKYISKTETVRVGDVVISSGLSGVYPKGLLLGAVASSDQNGLFHKIYVTPFVDFSKLEEVLVLLPKSDVKK